MTTADILVHKGETWKAEKVSLIHSGSETLWANAGDSIIRFQVQGKTVLGSWSQLLALDSVFSEFSPVHALFLSL